MEKKWPTDCYLPQSNGRCEICGNHSICYDVPSRHLPLGIPKLNEHLLVPELPVKTCTIINGRFCWILQVDNVEIPFNGGHHAEYFQNLYSKLGYKVEIKNESDES